MPHFNITHNYTSITRKNWQLFQKGEITKTKLRRGTHTSQLFLPDTSPSILVTLSQLHEEKYQQLLSVFQGNVDPQTPLEFLEMNNTLHLGQIAAFYRLLTEHCYTPMDIHRYQKPLFPLPEDQLQVLHIGSGKQNDICIQDKDLASLELLLISDYHEREDGLPMYTLHAVSEQGVSILGHPSLQPSLQLLSGETLSLGISLPLFSDMVCPRYILTFPSLLPKTHTPGRTSLSHQDLDDEIYLTSS
ncbi:hypothetical protein J4410_04725 [Candidatus Woesearchaeota archaeon]|nr:hypothetical protein [Candidatus Woesearchaeota archaeon]